MGDNAVGNSVAESAMSTVTVLRSLIESPAQLIFLQDLSALQALSRERAHHSLTRKSQKTPQSTVSWTYAGPNPINVGSAPVRRFKGTYLASLPVRLNSDFAPAFLVKAI